ncbi:MAG: uracil phosphoribosyltransferase [Mariniphaga sp.]
MRTQSEYYTPDVGLLLNNLSTVSQATPEAYKNTFYRIGNELAVILNRLLSSPGSTMLACTSEDADWLAKGLLDGLSVKNPALAVFWNERYRHPNNESIVVSPIVKSYIENLDNCKTLIIVKSIIVTSCVVRTQLSHLIEKINPERIFIIAPVMFKDSEQNLRDEFPLSISNKFHFVTLAIDDELNENGEVIPGIGGMVYSRLGLGNVHQKNKYIPEIVKQRRG